jgi:hypothetical protein
MLPEIMQKNSVIKLVGLLNSRYGLGFKLSSMTAAVGMDLKDMTVERRGSSLHIPICARGKFLATAIVSGATSLSDRDISAVSDMVKLVLEPALFSLFLDRQEQNETARMNHSSDVLSLYGSLKPVSEESYRPEFSTPALLLQAQNPMMITRIATHIHEIGERWAMLNFSDVRSEVHSIEDLKQLGAMTLVVEDILTLTHPEQKLLAEYAKVGSSQAEPLILFGVTSKLEDLISEGLVVEDFNAILIDSRIELERLPTDFAMMREAIELILDRKALLH